MFLDGRLHIFFSLQSNGVKVFLEFLQNLCFRFVAFQLGQILDVGLQISVYQSTLVGLCVGLLVHLHDLGVDETSSGCNRLFKHYRVAFHYGLHVLVCLAKRLLPQRLVLHVKI